MFPERLLARSTSAELRTLGSTPHARPGIRTQVLLVLAMAIVTVTVTAMCLFLIRQRLRAQVTDDLSHDLSHSVVAFHNLQAERLSALERENALLAELPTLKALMTSGDDLTIQDGATDFWQLSGDDLFALADPGGRTIVAYARNAAADESMRAAIRSLISSPGKHYLIHGTSLYACSAKALYFGSDEAGTLLGYVISGLSIDRAVRQISQPTSVEATFLSGGRVVASTLNAADEAALIAAPVTPGASTNPHMVRLARARFLSAVEDLSPQATLPLQLVVLKSLEPAERWIVRVDRTILSTGLLALFSGTVLMIILSRLLTRPLEELSTGVRAFGLGDTDFRIPRHGTREVRQLSEAFAAMCAEIEQANRARLESERLATIGRMASSVSHDLRHYLAAVYANAEFLASDRLSLEEREEIFADIRTAVLGTTDMIESLLTFSRTGKSLRSSPELVTTLLESATTLLRAHPDSQGVKLIAHLGEPTNTAAFVDAKQIERALLNLLLNACQAARIVGNSAMVEVTLEVQPQYLSVYVKDNGIGVPEGIRESLFDPFVSEGKQKGTGLGLTLAHRIAVEHGGGVTLLRSVPGETIFQLKVARVLQHDDDPASPSAASQRSGHRL
ncbi:HAMP domain-containing sensor histidine kinase [Acidipila sp. EB88]|uniref:sensor histidine kinase n=1 Tax=Acidipila sp. EB88 TaxID=2305226 RepID=UPI0013154FA3|nr:HAMP domain-containing sensor histidine kinase [Acidipila sp. EB88]